MWGAAVLDLRRPGTAGEEPTWTYSWRVQNGSASQRGPSNEVRANKLAKRSADLATKCETKTNQEIHSNLPGSQ